ncbi:MAG: PQQ-binding-like beta-propeller repeat protein, partial [Planctomycetes bacterium]|nr:PQQ-binding-like beta-propeller repeat protein [Planctomycetota bacterium]
KLWERQFWSTGRTMCHPKTCMAAPTPASDGESIFAFFATNDLFCLDLDGNLIWLRGLAHDYPNASNATGMASSPIVAGGIVVVQVENQSHSFAAGIDAGTGVNIWKIPRGSNPSWSTPVLLSYGDGDAAAVVLESWDLVSGHDLRTGEQIWVHEEKCYCIPSCALHEGLVLVPSGGLTALRPGARGEAPEVAWRSTRLRPATSSPVVHRGSVYALSGAGVLACGDASSGEARWQLRLKGPYSSTPVIAGEHIFCINEEGGVHVVRLGAEQGEVAGQAELGETILASPAIAQGGIFIRSDRHLWKFGKKK